MDVVRGSTVNLPANVRGWITPLAGAEMDGERPKCHDSLQHVHRLHGLFCGGTRRLISAPPRNLGLSPSGLCGDLKVPRSKSSSRILAPWPASSIHSCGSPKLRPTAKLITYLRQRAPIRVRRVPDIHFVIQPLDLLTPS